MLEESKIFDYFKTLTKEEDQKARIDILRYFEEGSNEGALYIDYFKWFFKMDG